MNENIDLVKILEHCPLDEHFWSPMIGDVKLYGIEQSAVIVREEMENGKAWMINADGTVTIGDITSPEIMLYPSREQRDWTKVKYEKKKELPKTWEEFCKNYPPKKGECYMDPGCEICSIVYHTDNRNKDSDRNILPSRQAAEAHIALMQLHQLRDTWREGWLPDWNDDKQRKYVILRCGNEYEILVYNNTSFFLSFQDEKRANEFLTNFRELIEQAGDLI